MSNVDPSIGSRAIDSLGDEILSRCHRISRDSEAATHSRDNRQAGETRELLRRTFDTAADLYAAARPSYPDALFDRLLEIGCATGTDRLDITCIHASPRMITKRLESRSPGADHLDRQKGVHLPWFICSKPAGVLAPSLRYEPLPSVPLVDARANLCAYVRS